MKIRNRDFFGRLVNNEIKEKVAKKLVTLLKERGPEYIREEDLKIDIETQRKFADEHNTEELNSIIENHRNSLTRKANNIDSIERERALNSKTSVAIFDISFENILPELENQEGSKLRNTQKKLGLLKDMLGFVKLTSIKELSNQSMFPIEYTFQELIPKRRNSLTRKNKFTDFENYQYGFEDEGEYNALRPYEYEVLTSASCIISTNSAYKLSQNLPGFLKDLKWKCLYSKTIDGSSYNS